MLTWSELYLVKRNPTINSITLEVLLNYYKNYLNPFIYKYHIVDDDKKQELDIELRFDEENFCHLLGIEDTVKKNVNRRDLHNYRGGDGWDKIQSGELTFEHIKSINRRGFKDCKSKYVFFYLIPTLISNPKAVLFDNTKCNTRLNCNFLLYDELQFANVHLGIQKHDNYPYYVPRSLLIEKITSTNDGKKFINNQQIITVSKINKTIMLL